MFDGFWGACLCVCLFVGGCPCVFVYLFVRLFVCLVDSSCVCVGCLFVCLCAC